MTKKGPDLRFFKSGSLCVASGTECMWWARLLPAPQMHVLCGEARRERKSAEEKTLGIPPLVEHAKFFNSFAFLLHNLAMSQPWMTPPLAFPRGHQRSQTLGEEDTHQGSVVLHCAHDHHPHLGLQCCLATPLCCPGQLALPSHDCKLLHSSQIAAFPGFSLTLSRRPCFPLH
jgi:hypothetical protein